MGSQKFSEYLLGNLFTSVTDINPLSHLQTAKLGTEQRWTSHLALCNFTIEYHPGKSNHNADALSQQYLEHIIFGTEVPALEALTGIIQQPAVKSRCAEGFEPTAAS